jgi:GTP-binding protein Era
MVQHAVAALNEADVVCLLVDAAERFGSGDAYMLDLIRRARAPRLLALNKVDRVSKPRLLPEIRRYADSGLFEEVVPISAETGDGCDALLDQLWLRLAVGEPRYDPALLTTQPERYHVAERIREQILRQTRDELPFTTAVVIDLWEEDAAAGRLRIFASILVETPGQKKILIGKGGERVREIGTRARGDLQEFLGRKLHLELHVRHEPKWRDDRHLLARLERDLEGDLGAG